MVIAIDTHYALQYEWSYDPVMRTNIVIDDELLAKAMAASGAKTKREAVELGLAALVRLDQQARIRRLRGKLTWTGDLAAMRENA
jgi:Arc/MetJ family transcription regulator